MKTGVVKEEEVVPTRPVDMMCFKCLLVGNSDHLCEDGLCLGCRGGYLGLI